MRKKIFLSLVLIMAITATALSQDRVTLYKDCDYRGDRHPLYEGEYHDYELGIGNDKLSSIQIPYGFSVTVYTENGFRGASQTFTSNVDCLPADLNDKVSSVKVTKTSGGKYKGNGYAPNNSHPDMVTVYRDGNFRGASQFLSAGYHNDNGLGVGNDQISSIKIPAGWEVTVYTNSNYSGSSKTYTSDVSNLYEFNDKISSILISKASNHPSYKDEAKRSKEDNFNKTKSTVNAVTVYRDSNYRGISRELGYGYHNDNALGVGNDQISSIRIPRGYSVTVYTNSDFKGKSRTFTSDVSQLDWEFNDQISSILVSKLK